MRSRRAACRSRSRCSSGSRRARCLACEALYRAGRRVGALIAFTGGLIGPPDTAWSLRDAAFADMPVLLGGSRDDPFVPATRMSATAVALRQRGARELHAVRRHRARDRGAAGARSARDPCRDRGAAVVCVSVARSAARASYAAARAPRRRASRRAARTRAAPRSSRLSPRAAARSRRPNRARRWSRASVLMSAEGASAAELIA